MLEYSRTFLDQDGSLNVGIIDITKAHICEDNL